MGFARLIVFGVLFLCIAYLVVAWYSRSTRREKLEKEWDAEVQEGDRDAYIEQGMQEYEHSLRRRLILLVIVMPVLAVVGIVYVINFM